MAVPDLKKRVEQLETQVAEIQAALSTAASSRQKNCRRRGEVRRRSGPARRPGGRSKAARSRSKENSRPQRFDPADAMILLDSDHVSVLVDPRQSLSPLCWLGWMRRPMKWACLLWSSRNSYAAGWPPFIAPATSIANSCRTCGWQSSSIFSWTGPLSAGTSLLPTASRASGGRGCASARKT